MVDWLTSSAEDRAALFKIVDRYIKERSGRWEAFLKVAYADVINAPGKEDAGNFRKGTLARSRVHLIANWFKQMEPAIADIIESGPQFYDSELNDDFAALIMNQGPEFDKERPDLFGIIRSQIGLRRFGKADPTSWESFLEEKGQFGKIDVELLNGPSSDEPAMSGNDYDTVQQGRSHIATSVAPPDRNPVSKIRPKIGEEFCFRLNGGFSGMVLGFQSRMLWWEPLPLQGSMMATMLSSKHRYLPFSDRNKPLPLVEQDQPGRRKFAFIISNDPLLTDFLKLVSDQWKFDDTVLDAFVQRLSASRHPYQVLRLDVHFELA